MTILEAITILEEEMEWVDKNRALLEANAKKSLPSRKALTAYDAHKLAIEALSYFLDGAPVLPV